MPPRKLWINRKMKSLQNLSIKKRKELLKLEEGQMEQGSSHCLTLSRRLRFVARRKYSSRISPSVTGASKSTNSRGILFSWSSDVRSENRGGGTEFWMKGFPEEKSKISKRDGRLWQARCSEVFPAYDAVRERSVARTEMILDMILIVNSGSSINKSSQYLTMSCNSCLMERSVSWLQKVNSSSPEGIAYSISEMNDVGSLRFQKFYSNCMGTTFASDMEGSVTRLSLVIPRDDGSRDEKHYSQQSELPSRPRDERPLHRYIGKRCVREYLLPRNEWWVMWF
jgi:hypothetical protein